MEGFIEGYKVQKTDDSESKDQQMEKQESRGLSYQQLKLELHSQQQINIVQARTNEEIQKSVASLEEKLFKTEQDLGLVTQEKDDLAEQIKKHRVRANELINLVNGLKKEMQEDHQKVERNEGQFTKLIENKQTEVDELGVRLRAAESEREAFKLENTQLKRQNTILSKKLNYSFLHELQDRLGSIKTDSDHILQLKKSELSLKEQLK